MISSFKRLANKAVKWVGRRTRRLLEWLGVLKRRPTSIKPTGTISKMFGVSEGVHPVYRGPYIRYLPIEPPVDMDQPPH